MIVNHPISKRFKIRFQTQRNYPTPVRMEPIQEPLEHTPVRTEPVWGPSEDTPVRTEPSGNPRNTLPFDCNGTGAGECATCSRAQGMGAGKCALRSRVHSFLAWAESVRHVQTKLLSKARSGYDNHVIRDTWCEDFLKQGALELRSAATKVKCRHLSGFDFIYVSVWTERFLSPEHPIPIFFCGTGKNL